MNSVDKIIKFILFTMLLSFISCVEDNDFAEYESANNFQITSRGRIKYFRDLDGLYHWKYKFNYDDLGRTTEIYFGGDNTFDHKLKIMFRFSYYGDDANKMKVKEIYRYNDKGKFVDIIEPDYTLIVPEEETFQATHPNLTNYIREIDGGDVLLLCQNMETAWVTPNHFGGLDTKIAFKQAHRLNFKEFIPHDFVNDYWSPMAYTYDFNEKGLPTEIYRPGPYFFSWAKIEYYE
ncbi:hypothetical protein [Tenacibaculum xiamenense]|uniref:hypothetical protein n=1 Tax=Tenacibaculum xiamenense TaxID=1261553 RepID=UPI0038933441